MPAVSWSGLPSASTDLYLKQVAAKSKRSGRSNESRSGTCKRRSGGRYAQHRRLPMVTFGCGHAFDTTTQSSHRTITITSYLVRVARMLATDSAVNAQNRYQDCTPWTPSQPLGGMLRLDLPVLVSTPYTATTDSFQPNRRANSRSAFSTMINKLNRRLTSGARGSLAGAALLLVAVCLIVVATPQSGARTRRPEVDSVGRPRLDRLGCSGFAPGWC